MTSIHWSFHRRRKRDKRSGVLSLDFMMPRISPEQVAREQANMRRIQTTDNLLVGLLGFAGLTVLGLIIWFIAAVGWKAVVVLFAIPVVVMLCSEKGRVLLGKIIEKVAPWLIGLAAILFLGEHYGWNRHYGIPV